MRKILLPFAALAFLIAGCASTTPVTTNTVATEVSILAAGLQPLAVALQADNVDPKILAEVNADLITVQKDAATIASETATPAASTLQEIVRAVQDIAAVATPVIPGGSATVVVIDAATSLAEVLLTDAGVASVDHNAKAVAPVYAKPAAELILLGNAAHK